MPESASEVVVTTLELHIANYEANLKRAGDAAGAFATRLEQKMAAAAEKTEAQTRRATESLRENFNQLLGKVDSVTSLVGVSLTAAFASIGAVAGKALFDAVSKTEELNKAMTKSAQLADRLAKATERVNANAAERLEAASADPAARLAELNRQIEDAERNQVGLKSAVASARKGREQADFWREKEGSNTDAFAERVRLAGLYVTRSQGDLQEQLETAAKEAESRVHASMERLADLGRERERLLNPDLDDRKNKAVNEMTRAIELQTKSFGLQGDALELLKLKWEGFGEAQIKRVRDAQAAREQLMKAVAGMTLAGGFGLMQSGPDRKFIDDTTAALKKQADTWGLSADAVALYDLRLKGASAEQLAMVEAAQKQKDALIAAKTAMMFAGTFGLLQSGGPAAKVEDKALSSMAGGTSAAANAITAAMRSTRVAAQNDPATKSAKELEALNRKTDESIRVLGTMTEAIQGVRDAIDNLGVA